jgi:hypothetical protein
MTKEQWTELHERTKTFLDLVLSEYGIKTTMVFFEDAGEPPAVMHTSNMRVLERTSALRAVLRTMEPPAPPLWTPELLEQQIKMMHDIHQKNDLDGINPGDAE